MDRWLGITISGDKAVIVDATIPPEKGDIIINADFNIKLQKGNRPAAYSAFSQELGDYVRENHVTRVIIKGSALPQAGKPKLTLLEAAELRGVAISTCANVCETETITKAAISRNFGDRKADEYIEDQDFWAEHFSGELRAGSREAAFCILASLTR